MIKNNNIFDSLARNQRIFPNIPPLLFSKATGALMKSKAIFFSDHSLTFYESHAATRAKNMIQRLHLSNSKQLAENSSLTHIDCLFTSWAFP